MRTLLIFCLLSFSVLTYAQDAQASTQVTAEKKMLNTMETMKHDYERFIDTHPSAEKNKLARKVKEETELFAKQYPDVPQLPAVLELRKEVDIYLSETD